MSKKALILTSIIIFYSGFLVAQDFSDVTIKTYQLSPSIYMLEGAGGNMGLCFGQEGAFLIDDQFAPLTARIKSAIEGITDQPVKFVINTHYHGDHVGGNENLANEGAIIFSHKNTRKRIEAAQLEAIKEGEQENVSLAALPKITFDASMDFHYNGLTIAVFYLGNGHTDGDVVIYFTEENIFHMGDLFVRYGFPYIDMKNGGDVLGMIAALDRVLQIANDESKFIPGHGEVATMGDVKEFRDMLYTISERVKTAKDAGTSFEDLDLEALKADFEDIPGNAESFFKAAYESLK